MYKYALDRTSKKFRCPKCDKKTFVRYVDNTSKLYLEEHYGRCDRESKCSYHSSPLKNQLLKTFQHVAATLPPTYLNEKETITAFCNDYENNHFISYLLGKFPEEKIVDVIYRYFLGSNGAWKGATIFWQIDEHHNIHTGKVMLYDRNTGKRVKTPYPHINWMHKVLQKTPYVLQQCLFGLHLIHDEIDEKTICIVESEKTAVIMSIKYPSYHWMATGAKTNLKLEFLLPIKNYKIILYPDKTEFNDWNEKSKMLINKGFLVQCSKLLEEADIELGADLADLILK